MKLLFALLLGIMAAASSFGAAAFAQDGYAIRAGDVLRIEILEDPELNRSALVAPDGRISMPLAGSIKASGRTVETVQADLAARLAPNFATTPTVFVSVERVMERPAGAAAAPNTIDIFVMGEAAKPGRLAVEPGITVLQLFAEMGGLTPFAATKRIQLRRTDASGIEKIYLINYDAVEQGTSNVGNTVLRDDDVILIPQRRLFE